MKLDVKAWICTLGMVASAAGVHAAINPTDTPYSIISVRNVFDLREQPKPETGPTTPVAPPLNVKLTGLTTILGYKQAVFSVTEQGKPQAITVVLSEGEAQGGVELLTIDMTEKSASIKNDGRSAMLKLDEKVGPGGGGAVAPAVAGTMGGGRGVMPGVTPPVQGGGNPQFTYGGGRGAAPNAGAASPFNPQGTMQPTGYGAGGVPDQANTLGTAATSPYGAPQRQLRTDAQAPTLTPDQQALLIETQRARLLQTGDTMANIFPPTPYSSSLQSELQNQQQSQGGGPPSIPPGSQPFGSKSTGSLLVPGR